MLMHKRGVSRCKRYELQFVTARRGARRLRCGDQLQCGLQSPQAPPPRERDGIYCPIRRLASRGGFTGRELHEAHFSTRPSVNKAAGKMTAPIAYKYKYTRAPMASSLSDDLCLVTVSTRLNQQCPRANRSLHQ